MPTVEGRGVTFTEAAEFFREKVRLPTRTWTDLREGMHARAFVVAGAMRDNLIEDFQNAVQRGLDDGTTLETFRKEFDAIVARHGWSYKGGRNWRSRVIFDTNMRTAYMAGRWEQIQQAKARRPYLRYVAVLDERTRPEHRAWHGTVLQADDAWWQTHYPPNGWNCRCTVQQLSERDLQRFGFKEADAAPPVAMEDRSVNTPDGPKTVQAPKGVDTGWGYNVGEAATGRGTAAEVAAMEAHEESGGFKRFYTFEGESRPATPAPLVPEPTRTRRGPAATDAASMRRALTRALGAEKATLVDPVGGRVKVGEALVKHQLARGDRREVFWPYLRELVEDPHEIWVGFVRHPVSGRVSVRRRYVKLMEEGRGRVLALVADTDKGDWSALTFFPERDRQLTELRWGLRLYAKGE